jgi:peptide/nickel transport system permease protein
VEASENLTPLPPFPRGEGGDVSPARSIIVGWAWLLPLVALAIFAATAPLLAPFDPLRIDPRLASLEPTLAHPLGTDRLGRDFLSRWLVGGQTSLLVAGFAAALAGGVGGLLGAIAGYRGGAVGTLLDRLVDVTLALPVFFVAIALQAALPSNAVSLVLVVGLATWMAPARVVRAQVIAVKRTAFVEAARALGCSETQLLWRHVLPHSLAAFAAALTAAFGDALLLQSTLGFLGLGIAPPAPSWGGLLLDAMPEMLHGAWWQVLVPGLSIVGATALVGAAARRIG